MGLLRLSLALIVVLAHLGILPGWFGPASVCCFFVISGFYMQLLLRQPVNVKNFYASRALRIFPAYWLFVAFDAAINHFHPTFWQAFTTIFIAGRDIEALQGDLLPVGPGWSLAPEVYFYALAPFILCLNTRYLTLIGVVSGCILVVLASAMHWQAIVLFPCDLSLFLLGALAYRTRSPFAWLFTATKNIKLDRFIGNLSYPLYLSHAVIAPYLLANGINSIFVAVSATTLASMAVYTLLELPIDNFRHIAFNTTERAQH
jgi:peptidoglycan/LPS O-acetylase OafA/YrhL